jgi:hypothetical protein
VIPITLSSGRVPRFRGCVKLYRLAAVYPDTGHGFQHDRRQIRAVGFPLGVAATSGFYPD